MNRHLKLAMSALLLAAFCLPALAQEEEAASGAPTENSEAKPAAEPAAKPAAKKPAKKKAKKKKPAEPVSEYKFTAAESVPTYKFDKKANPIVKDAKKKKPAKKGAKGKKGAAPAAKLKTTKPIAEQGQAPEQQGAPQGSQQDGGGEE